MTSPDPAATAPLRHTLIEDVYATLTGCAFAVFGLVWLKATGLVTGGIAGLALLLSYLVPVPVGLLFALLNIPFFVLASATMGRGFLLKAVLATVLISLFAIMSPFAFRIEVVNPVFASLFGGTMIGVGLLLLARHRVGVGGLGILALALQQWRGWNAGRTLLVGDSLILLTAIPALDLDAGQLALSVMSAAAAAGVLIFFHRAGRYTGY